jgi:phosphate starvation-inducible PhoH-like protein
MRTKELIELREGESRGLFGPQDRHLRVTRETFGVNVYARGSELHVEGEVERVRLAHGAFVEMLGHLRSRGSLSEDDVFDIIRQQRASALGSPENGNGDAEGFAAIDPKFRVVPRTEGQQAYVEAIKQNDLVIVMGPAGTGKTYLAVAMAITALRKGLYRKMVLARPAVEAGEKLGFLPGDYQAKVSPYLRPLYDALHDLVDVGQVKRYVDRDVIEVIPLAFMRGRTLDRAFVILDEAQNTTRSQMKMVLTRLGQGAKLVITGDDTQIDLPHETPSGLIHAGQILRGIRGIGMVRLGRDDIVRHRLVQDIVDAYEHDEQRNGRV